MFGIQLKALSLIHGIGFFTAKFHLHKTCIVIFQDLSKCYSVGFFPFKCKPINFCQSSLAEIQTFGEANPASFVGGEGREETWLRGRFCAFSHARKLTVNCLKLS